MKSKIINFFTDSADVLLSPDDLFNLKSQSKNYDGILTLIVFTVLLALTLGILTKSALATGILIISGLFSNLIFKIIQALLINLATRLFGAKGDFLRTFNLISYSSVLDVFIIIGLAGTVLGLGIIFPLLFLTVVWKMFIVVSVVCKEYELGIGKAFISAYGIWLLVLAIIMGLFL